MNGYSIAKALHHLYFARDYLEQVIIDNNLTGNSKQFINIQSNKVKSAINDVYTRMSTEGATMLRNELERRDIAAIDSINNILITLDEDKRAKVEDYLNDLIK